MAGGDRISRIGNDIEGSELRGHFQGLFDAGSLSVFTDKPDSPDPNRVTIWFLNG